MKLHSLPLTVRTHRKPTLALLALASSLCAFAPTAFAQSQSKPPSLETAHLAGSTHAFNAMCGQTGDNRIGPSKEQDKARAGRFGIDSASFDKAFAAGEQEFKREERALSEAEKAQMCVEVRAMHEKGAAAARAADARR